MKSGIHIRSSPIRKQAYEMKTQGAQSHTLNRSVFRYSILALLERVQEIKTLKRLIPRNILEEGILIKRKESKQKACRKLSLALLLLRRGKGFNPPAPLKPSQTDIP